MKISRYATLAAIFAATLALVLLTGCDASASKYQKAIDDIDKGNYTEAIAAFEELGEYEQSEQYLAYAQAKEALDASDWDKAIKLFSNLKGFLDVDDAYIANIRVASVTNADKMPIKEALTVLAECQPLNEENQKLMNLCTRLAACLGSYYSPEYDPNERYHSTTELELDFYLSHGTPYFVGRDTGIPFAFEDAPVVEGVDGYEFGVYTESPNGDAVFCFSSDAAKVNAGGLTRTLYYSK